MLRAFREEEGSPYRYQLVEIPTALFGSVQKAPIDVFQRDAPSINCEVGGKLAAVIAIDRSDAKITVKRIQLSACTVHAEWHRT
jgi:hypothetical protein